MCENPINFYLKTLKTKLDSNSYKELNIVLGNESCDLDSAVSSLVYATYLHWCNEEKGIASNKAKLLVPVLNVKREDINLKTEVVFCLKQYGINIDLLIFRNDYALETWAKIPRFSVLLVDHHILAEADKFLEPYVTEIIDHRPIDTHNWTYGANITSSVVVMGSCCTLVTQKIKESNKYREFYRCFPMCADLLHCGIILDTVNFSKEVNKAQPLDEEMVLFLESLMNTKEHSDRQRILDNLLQARSDVSSLSTKQLFQKDLKIIEKVLIPTIPVILEDVFKRADVEQALIEILSSNNCEIILLLGVRYVATAERDVAIYSSTKTEKAFELGRFLEAAAEMNLMRVEGTSLIPNIIYYKQGNLSASRKQYIPIVRDFLKHYQKKCGK